jgi:hypothetical protein
MIMHKMAILWRFFEISVDNTCFESRSFSCVVTSQGFSYEVHKKDDKVMHGKLSSSDYK